MLPFTPYVDLYTALNPHIVVPVLPVERSPVATYIVSMLRNPMRVVSDEQTIRTNLNRVFGFTDGLYSSHTVHFPGQVSIVQKPTIVSSQMIIDINYRWSGEYYHFLTEVLPNALYLCAKYPSAPILCTRAPFTESIFRWFGVQNPITSNRPASAGTVQAPFVQCGNPSPEAIHRVRSVVESKLTFEKTTGILIRRHGTRFVENEDELFEECKALFPDLSWTIFDRLSHDDTARLFSKAAVIVAPHGAGLTNMLFSPKGIAIYEFMPVDEPNICYWHLSELMGNAYTMIPSPCDPATRSMTCKLLGAV